MNLKKLTAEIESNKFDKFKSECASNGKTIKEVIEEFVSSYIESKKFKVKTNS